MEDIPNTNRMVVVVQGATGGENIAEFEMVHDGSFHVAVHNSAWGGHYADIALTAEQFSAFKQWVMGNGELR